jgi:pimeloyl-ACP methyl ester carboxylesterase
MIDCPALLVIGDADHNVPSADQQRQLTQSYLPRGQLSVIKNAGHLLPMQTPQTLAELMLDFAQKL